MSIYTYMCISLHNYNNISNHLSICPSTCYICNSYKFITHNIILCWSGTNQTNQSIMIQYRNTTIGDRQNPKTSRSHYFRDTYLYLLNPCCGPSDREAWSLESNKKLFWLLFMITVAPFTILSTYYYRFLRICWYIDILNCVDRDYTRSRVDVDDDANI